SRARPNARRPRARRRSGWGAGAVWARRRGDDLVRGSSNPGRGAGLSHMSKEFVEEFFAPSGELHFAGGRSRVWVDAQDVEGLAPDDGDILWSTILARSRVVFVEDDIERPVQMVFYAPMGSIDLQHALGREPFGEGDIVHPAGGLAFAQPPLGFDASERGEAGKGRRIR